MIMEKARERLASSQLLLGNKAQNVQLLSSWVTVALKCYLHGSDEEVWIAPHCVVFMFSFACVTLLFRLAFREGSCLLWWKVTESEFAGVLWVEIGCGRLFLKNSND